MGEARGKVQKQLPCQSPCGRRISTNPMTDLPHIFFFQEVGFSVALAHMATPPFRPLKRLRAKTLETDVTG